MSNCLEGLPGPFFEFIITEKGAFQREYEQSDPLMDYYHHPDALAVSDDIIDLILQPLMQSHPHFNRWGDTEYADAELRHLCMWLEAYIRGLEACRTRKEFEGVFT